MVGRRWFLRITRAAAPVAFAMLCRVWAKGTYFSLFLVPVVPRHCPLLGSAVRMRFCVAWSLSRWHREMGALRVLYGTCGMYSRVGCSLYHQGCLTRTFATCVSSDDDAA